MVNVSPDVFGSFCTPFQMSIAHWSHYRMDIGIFLLLFNSFVHTGVYFDCNPSIVYGFGLFEGKRAPRKVEAPPISPCSAHQKTNGKKDEWKVSDMNYISFNQYCEMLKINTTYSRQCLLTSYYLGITKTILYGNGPRTVYI